MIEELKKDRKLASLWVFILSTTFDEKKKTPESTPVPDYKKLINHSAPDKIAKIYRCPVTYDKQI